MSDNRQEDDQLRVLVTEAGRPPCVKEIHGGIPAIKKIVRGEIEELCPFDDAVALIRSRRRGMRINCLLKNGSGQPYEVIRGTFVIVGTDHGQYVSLTDSQIMRYLAEFGQNRLCFASQNRPSPCLFGREESEAGTLL